MNSQNYAELVAKPVIEQMFDMLDEARNQIVNLVDMAKSGKVRINEEVLNELSDFVARTEKYVATDK
jgi:hypothetical protein